MYLLKGKQIWGWRLPFWDWIVPVLELQSFAINANLDSSLSRLSWHPACGCGACGPCPLTSRFHFRVEAELWAKSLRLRLYLVCAVLQPADHFSDLKAAFGKAQALSRSNGYGFYSTGTPWEVSSIRVTRPPQFLLLAHHPVFIVRVLLPAEPQHGDLKNLKPPPTPPRSCYRADVMLSDDPWTCLPSGRSGPPKQESGGGKPTTRAHAEPKDRTGCVWVRQGQHLWGSFAHFLE